MKRYILLSVAVVLLSGALSALCSGEALADPKGNRTVTVTCDPLVTPDFGQCDAEEKLTVVNGCGITIQVSFNGGAFQTVLAGGSIQFDCTNDLHDCYTVNVPGAGGTSTGCSEPAGWEVPTLSEWLLIVLALSVGAFFIWQLKRRRKAVASV